MSLRPELLERVRVAREREHLPHLTVLDPEQEDLIELEKGENAEVLLFDLPED